MPAVIQDARFAEYLRQRFGVKGHFGLSVIDDVFPVVPYPAGPELDLALRVVRWAFGEVSPAVPGQVGHIGVRNPPGSGKLVVVEEVVLAGVGTNFYESEQAGLVLPSTAVTLRSTDARLMSDSGTVSSLQTQGSLAAIAVPFGRTLRTLPPGTFACSAVLPPNRSWRMEATVVNVGCLFAVRGYERDATEEELRTLV